MDAAARTILVVEDERIVAKDLQQTLAGFGYRVPHTAATSDDAIRLVAESCPDLVLMDIRIKGDRDGIETAEILRRDFDIPVVYLTAYADADTITRAKQTSPHGYLIKPVKPEELHSTVEIALHRHEMERRLREREHLASTTLRSIGDAVIATDPEGRITFVNENAELLINARAESLIGTDVASAIRLVDERTNEGIENPIARALREGKVGRTVPAALQTQQGERAIDDTTTPIVDADGKVLGAVLVFRDVTAHRQAQNQLVLADRLSSLGTMAAGIAHEINNPLAVIVANGALAMQEIADLESTLATATPAAISAALGEVAAMIKDMRQSAERAAKIVGDLRTFSRPIEEGPRSVDVRDALEWALRITEAQLRTRAKVVRALAPVPPIHAAEARVGQVFVNLLVNAAHTLAEGDRARNEIRVATHLVDGSVVVDISDNGPTLAPEARARIFEPFSRRQAGNPGAGARAPYNAGSGLELAVSHGIVRALGGTITAEVAPGGGTLFRIVLPALVQAPAPPPAITNDNGPRGHIVLIDDEPLLLSSLTRVLSREHEVHAFSNPYAALELVTSRTDLDLVLCDLIMPGMSGIDIYERVLDRAPETAAKFVFVTGGAYTQRGKEFISSVKNPCLEKPFGPDRLRAFVKDFLVKARAPAS